jgi:hypothetical protein
MFLLLAVWSGKWLLHHILMISINMSNKSFIEIHKKLLMTISSRIIRWFLKLPINSVSLLVLAG